MMSHQKTSGASFYLIWRLVFGFTFTATFMQAGHNKEWDKVRGNEDAEEE